MCSISGIIGHISEKNIQDASKSRKIIKYRGPDDDGIYLDKGAVLTHNRLSIIDINPRSSQPMQCNEGRFIITFNGEIYNYIELREELKKAYNFTTCSDTEVLLAAYLAWKEKALDKVVGMFAFCIYDSLTKEAFLARDEFGQKPLYYSLVNENLVFASEVKSLLCFSIQPKTNLNIWGRYLIKASYDDSSRTYFENINQLLPGEFLKFSLVKGLKKKRYYNLSKNYNPNNYNILKTTEIVKEKILETCNLHMRSDVKVGIMLSGGLDSSTMLAALKLNNSLSDNIISFSVDFGEEFSEKEWIEQAANQYDVETNIEGFSVQDFYKSIKPMIWHLEGPVGGLMNCALLKVMQKAKNMGVKVLLDGTGPDECFGGYKNHQNLYLGGLMKSQAKKKFEKAVFEYMKIWNVSKDKVFEAIKNENNNLRRYYTAIDGTKAVMTESLTENMLNLDISHEDQFITTKDDLKDSLIYYLQGSKIPRNMRMLDRLSMAYGIEVRMPFITRSLIEAGLNMPSEYYFHNGYTKGIVREAFKKDMNDEVRLAVKRNIQAPQSIYLKSKIMKEYIYDMINSDAFKSRGIFRSDQCNKLFKKFLKGEFENSFFIWQWIIIEEWHEIFIDNNATLKKYYIQDYV